MSTVVNAPGFQLIKLCAITIYVGLELSLLVLAAMKSFRLTSMFLPSSAVKFVSALSMIILSFVDHRKSLRPSVLLTSYLILTMPLDVAQARTLFLSSSDRPELIYSSIFSATLGLKVGILLLETQQKSRWINWNGREHSPEETSGIFSLSVFFWLNKIFLRGYKKILLVEDLYPLDNSLNSNVLHEKFSRNMDYSKVRGVKFGLVKILMHTLKFPLLLPVPLHLALLGFTFCQPLLSKNCLITYLSLRRTEKSDTA
ncbi:hypothetical protein AJ79_03907 [Helicocarpus griseus UAMH5409]|uniref:Uncharacterized protein n=1 Tax=Helicocarpus griseus UAMH5409 TaxID=1447875 RepID=A0A2B7XVN4_9EURO|nr:hypothetical protein AJ79_03907 [Helicocarpus griseus UAMH5409]